MSYVIYNTETTRKLNDRYYVTKAAAKAGLTRAAKADNTLIRSRYAIADANEFHANIEKTVTKTNWMTGEDYQERANTPLHMSPSSETYWSM